MYHCFNIETVKAGLNTVQLIGDVSAVHSAVDAAVELVQDKPYYLASHVISRLDNQTDLLLYKRETVKQAKKEIASTAETIPSEKSKKSLSL